MGISSYVCNMATNVIHLEHAGLDGEGHACGRSYPASVCLARRLDGILGKLCRICFKGKIVDKPV